MNNSWINTSLYNILCSSKRHANKFNLFNLYQKGKKINACGGECYDFNQISCKNENKWAHWFWKSGYEIFLITISPNLIYYKEHLQKTPYILVPGEGSLKGGNFTGQLIKSAQINLFFSVHTSFFKCCFNSFYECVLKPWYFGGC